MTVEAALQEVRAALSLRGKPEQIDCCSHCFTADEVRYLLQTPPERINPDELSRVLWDAFWTWGDWPTFAYYVPALLQIFLERALLDDEMLYTKLLIAARPELKRDAAVGEPMTPDETDVLYSFFSAVLDQRIRTAFEQSEWPEGAFELFGFLAAMPQPVEPLVTRLKGGAADEQGFWAGTLAQLVRNGYRWNRLLQNTYLEKLRATPENEARLLEEVEPEPATLYLLDHLEHVTLFGDEMLPVVEVACGL